MSVRPLKWTKNKIATDIILQANNDASKGSLVNCNPSLSTNNRSPLTRDQEVALSFQIMTCAEPPELVIETINSILAIKSDQDEILIIDNNNQKKHLYQPLADYCNQLNPKLKVRFYHIDTIEGYKAGALNQALQLMDANCTHIVVVDSDYQALPHARVSIANALAHYPTHSLLQFPQFYRSSGQAEVHSELNHYFNHHLFRGFNRDKALSTGTYAVIKCSDLIKLGGWSSDSITEDAQMGVNMHRSGLYTQFVPEVIATGLLPNTLRDLMCQRRRWIYGNMQVFTNYISSVQTANTSTETGRTQTLAERLGYLRAHLSQLTAWVNFTAPFILLHICTLLAIAAVVLFPTILTIDSTVIYSLLAVVYGGYGLFVSRRLWAYLQDKAPLSKQLSNQPKFSLTAKLRTWLMHLNFWELGALSWLPVLWGQNKPFTCTPKQKSLDSGTNAWVKNLRVAPKLLILLNLITAVVVSPLTALYSPALFVAALGFLAIKLAAIIVATDNFTETESPKETQQTTMQPQSSINKMTDQLTQSKPSKLQMMAKLQKPIQPKVIIKPDQLEPPLANLKLSEFVANNEDFKDYEGKPKAAHFERSLNQ